MVFCMTHACVALIGSLAFSDSNQPVPGDDRAAFCGDRDIAKRDKLSQVGGRDVGRSGTDRDLDQRGKLFGRQKLWRVDGHRELGAGGLALTLCPFEGMVPMRRMAWSRSSG